MQESEAVHSWSEAKQVIALAKGPTERDIRWWATRVRTEQGLSRMYQEVKNEERALTLKISLGGYGICRHRVAPLSTQSDFQNGSGEDLTFGDLYRVTSESPCRRMIHVESPNGRAGWLPKEKHFGITRGEFKILSNSGKGFVLNYLVTAIHI